MSRTSILVLVALLPVFVGLSLQSGSSDCCPSVEREAPSRVCCCCDDPAGGDSHTSQYDEHSRPHDMPRCPIDNSKPCQCSPGPSMPYVLFQDTTLTFDGLFVTLSDLSGNLSGRTDEPPPPPPKRLD